MQSSLKAFTLMEIVAAMSLMGVAALLGFQIMAMARMDLRRLEQTSAREHTLAQADAALRQDFRRADSLLLPDSSQLLLLDMKRDTLVRYTAAAGLLIRAAARHTDTFTTPASFQRPDTNRNLRRIRVVFPAWSTSLTYSMPPQSTAR